MQVLRKCAALLAFGLTGALVAQQPSNQGSATVLHRDEAAKIMPATVFFRGQSAPTQGRNSGGVKFGDGMYLLAALVDTSGYATEVKQNYQGYLLTEVPVDFGGHPLKPGAYGFGFLDNHRFVVLDIGAHKLLETSSHALSGARPVPLQVLQAGQGFELCSGRDCVGFKR
jgi:hypothetical protein